MRFLVWAAVIISAIEASISGSAEALILGLILGFVGIYLEGRNVDVV